MEVPYMLPKIKELEKQAIRLPTPERAKLAEHLINSLDEEEDPDAERLWIEESERRYQKYKQGKVKAKTANKVFKDARSKLEKKFN